MKSEAGVKLSFNELIYYLILFSQIPALSDISKPWKQGKTPDIYFIPWLLL